MVFVLDGVLSGTCQRVSCSNSVRFAMGADAVGKGSFYLFAVRSSKGRVVRRSSIVFLKSSGCGPPDGQLRPRLNVRVVGAAVLTRRNSVRVARRGGGKAQIILCVPLNGRRLGGSRGMYFVRPRAVVRSSSGTVVATRSGERRRVTGDVATGPVSGPRAGCGLLIIRSRTSVHLCLEMLFSTACGVVVTRGKRRKMEVTHGRVPSLMVASIVVPIVGNFRYYHVLGRSLGAYRVPVVLLATLASSRGVIGKVRLKTSSCVLGPFGPRVLHAGMGHLVGDQARLGQVCAGLLVPSVAIGNSRRRGARAVVVRSPFVARVLGVMGRGLRGPRFGIGGLTRVLGVDRPALCEGMGRLAGFAVVRLMEKIQLGHSTRLLEDHGCGIRRMTRVINCGSVPAFEGRFISFCNAAPSAFGDGRSARSGGWSLATGCFLGWGSCLYDRVCECDVRSVEGVTVVTRMSRKGAALISGVVLTKRLFHGSRAGNRLMLSGGSLRHREKVAVLSGGISVGCGKAGVGVVSAPKRTSFNNRMRHMLGVTSKYVLLMSTFRNPVPRAHFMLRGTLRVNLGPMIMIGGISGPGYHPRRMCRVMFSLVFDLGTARSRLSFPIVCNSTGGG